MAEHDANVGSSLSPSDEALLSEELALHHRVREAVKAEALADMPDMDVIKDRLKELRDEAITANEHDLPALFQQLYTHHSLAARSFERKLPDMRAPYFAHLRLKEAGKIRDVLLGYQTFIDTKQDVTIIDWRHAALAKVFFMYREGDEYEIELPGRLAHGEVLVRRVITFEVGELVGIAERDRTLFRIRGGNWSLSSGLKSPSLAGGQGKAVNVGQFGIGPGRSRLPDVSALLDKEQYEILNSDDDGALLILGGAGSGKTTVALHRMANLSYKRPKFYHPRAMRVVVPEQGLVRLTERLLGGLQLSGVKASTFDGWVTDAGQEILKGMPKRQCEWTPASVIFIKRHSAMKKAVDVYRDVLLRRWCDELLKASGKWAHEVISAIMSDRDSPLLQVLERLDRDLQLKLTKANLAAEQKKWQGTVLSQVFADARKKLWQVDRVRSEIYTLPETEKVLLEAHAITEKMVQELHGHTRKQFQDTGFQDDYADDMRTIDDAAIEQDDYAGTIDVEDYAILLYYLTKVSGRVVRKTRSLSEYKHLVIDEAQDLASVEMHLLGAAIASDGTVTVAGDAVQQSDPTVEFHGWDQAMRDLGIGVVSESRLTTNYRCSRQVAEFGHKILGPLAPESLPKSIKEGEDVILSRYANDGVAFVAMTDALSLLLDREPLASIAIICESEERAESTFNALKNTIDVRLVIDGEFCFKPGIDITNVAQIKGLEFDYVILPDVNLVSYPDTPRARHALHIAVTRAVHQLWVMSVGQPSEILATI